VRFCNTGSVLKNLGPTSWAAAYVLKAERTRQGMSLRTLAAYMVDKVGPEDALSHATLSEIERGVRKISVDDLTALAWTLGISPVSFLMPVDRPNTPTAEVVFEEPVNLCALTGTPEAPVRAIVDWVRGEAPLTDTTDPHRVEAFRRRSLPWWLWNTEKKD
jgi:transcriptional regulator with XRE-family HTH domain